MFVWKEWCHQREKECETEKVHWLPSAPSFLFSLRDSLFNSPSSFPPFFTFFFSSWEDRQEWKGKEKTRFEGWRKGGDQKESEDKFELEKKEGVWSPQHFHSQLTQTLRWLFFSFSFSSRSGTQWVLLTCSFSQLADSQFVSLKKKRRKMRGWKIQRRERERREEENGINSEIKKRRRFVIKRERKWMKELEGYRDR